MHSSSSQAGSIRLTRERATRIRGGGGSDPMSKRLTDGGLLSWTRMSTMTKSDKVVLHANFNSSLVHPSDLINAALLYQNPDAKVVLTHDDVWCDLLRNNFPKPNYATLINIARSYTNTVDEYDCVSLEKISDSSNVLEESHRPLQGIKTQALQGLLTTPDDDNAPIPATISLALPRELVERILLLLDTESMLTCRLVNIEFNGIIQSSTLLQYFLACKAAGVTDNPQSPLSHAERLEALKKREDAWRKLKPVFEMTITVNRQSLSRKDLKYFHLSSFPQDDPRWIMMPGHGPALNSSGIFINFAAALYEHDLIVNFISSDTGNQADMPRHSLDLVLLKFSTGEYHPLARSPRIHVQRSPELDPRVVSRIAGDNIALVVHSRDVTFSDKIFIFDWKTGRKLLVSNSFYFRSLVIVPTNSRNMTQVGMHTQASSSSLQNYSLFPTTSYPTLKSGTSPPQKFNPKPPIQILSLQIPAVSPEYSTFSLRCYAEPDPFLHSMPYLPPRPFFSSPENSIIMVTLRMLSDSRRGASYNIIMHRRALLDTIQTWTSPALLEQQKYLPRSLTNEVTVHTIANPEDESVQLDVKSKLVSTMRHPRSSPRTRGTPTFATSQSSRTLATSHMSADPGSSPVSAGLSTNSSTSRCTFLQVPWEKWGPPISRWFQLDDTHVRWISNSNGQRYAFLEPNPLNGKKLVNVVDFNPHNLRRK
ncbi:hypothetical protein M378DRAFT_12410 [Amanita muscaria Koide BX008]|uniref:F-box domain-containing protein n=1 Tax=Amanita muscaria (strain Koide BX008) TaxID=946122 RepID=A0A0C2WN70_AMAMK|nr:hypothetical protein M378DRAFT_12410 [Amanita muscaria Koide BX008]